MTYSDARILVISEYFEPSGSATAQIATDLATDLASLSFQVVVLTSTAGTTRPDFEIVRVNKVSRRSSLVYIKAFSGILFLLKSLLWALKYRCRYDQVLIFSNPPFAGSWTIPKTVPPKTISFRSTRLVPPFSITYRNTALQGSNSLFMEAPYLLYHL